MSLKRMVGLMVVLLMVVPLTVQAGANFQEDYDSQTVNQPPGTPWYNILVGGVWVEDGPKVRSDPHALMVNNKGFNGVDKGSQAPLGGEYGASDACPLILEYFVYYGSSRQGKKADYYVVLSKGGVQPPPYGVSLPVAIDCVAYCQPFINKKTPAVFDGKKWTKAGFVTGGWNLRRMTVKSNALVCQAGSGGGTVTREYTGTFDTIAVYTKDFNDKSYTNIDDLSVTGGFTTITAGLDILPDNDPNYFTPNKRSGGRLPMAILGSADLDVTTIDFSTVNIAGVYPVKNKATYRDVDLDGYDDLELKFSRGDLIDALGLDMYEPGTMVDVTVSAKVGCDDLVATDVLVIRALSD